MIEVHQAQQTLDDRESRSGSCSPDSGEHCRPAPADQRVRDRGESRRQRGAEGRGDTGVIGDPFGIPVHRDGGRAADEFR